MKIEVYSYSQAEKKVESNNNLWWISIRDVGFDELYYGLDYAMADNQEKMLKLKFDDVTPFQVHHDLLHPFHRKVLGNRDPLYFSEEQCKAIKDFSDKVNAANDTLHIHCWAGKSRSRAVAYVLNVYYNMFLKKDKRQFIKNNESILVRDSMPNSEVVRLLSTYLMSH